MNPSVNPNENGTNDEDPNYPPKAKLIYDITVSLVKLEHGYMHEYEKKHLATRAKSFELLRLSEDCSRYHNAECSRELKEGIELYNELFLEFDRRRDEIIYSYSLRRYCEKYLAEYPQRRSNNAVTFPWASYDESMEKNCIGLLSSKHITEARSYLIGYIEVLCRDPLDVISNQGKVTMESAGWTINRHPYGSFMASFRIALAMLIKDVYRETVSLTSVKGIIDSFVLISQQAWTLHWEKCSKISFDFTELIVDAIQHALFLHCQYLPRLLYGSITTSFQQFELIELRQPLKLEDLHRVCGVPEAYRIHAAFSESSPQYQQLTRNAGIQESCWMTISSNPFLALSKDIDVLRFAKTPAEVADVAVSMLKSINRVSKQVNLQRNASVELTADEMIPLLSFSLALYFRTPIRDRETNAYKYQNPLNVSHT
jgi:hypothetical protein